MKVAFLVGLIVFCSLWTFGSFLQCSRCVSRVSYDDCQNNITLQNCAANSSCSQLEVQLSKPGNNSITLFEKRCLETSRCDENNTFEVGECITRIGEGFTGVCNGLCCTGENCNSGNLMPPTTPSIPSTTPSMPPTTPSMAPTTPSVTTTNNKGSVFIISVLVLLSGVLLTIININ